MNSTFRKRTGSVVRSSGFSLLELIIVVSIALILAGMMFPEFLTISYNIRLKDAAVDTSGLLQQARIIAARKNTVYTIGSPTANSFCAFNVANNACDPTVQTVTLAASVQLAAAAPTGSSGQPSPYVLVGDTTGSTPYTNGTTLGYSNRGLPCAYAGGVCATPAASYFVYYLTDTRPSNTGWAVVVVTRTGRSKTFTWNGGSWD